MALKRLCRFCGCNKYRMEGHNFCKDHLWYEEQKKEERERKRKESQDFSKFERSNPFYNTWRWKTMRKTFIGSHPYCEICGGMSEVVDHIIPPRGDEEMFFNTDNLQALCKSCHDAKTRYEINERNRKSCHSDT